MTIVYAIIMFCLLIFVHEFGHFITAKAVGIKVNEFALGMGPAVFKRQRGETLYSLRIFPIGGYCAMEGEDDDSDDARAFNNKSPVAKILVVVAGSAMNVILAVLVFTIILLYTGIPTATVGQVTDGSPAYEAGLISGDEIVAIEGKTIEEWQDILNIVGESTADTLVIEIKRNGQEMEIQTGVMIAEDGRRVIGVTSGLSRNPFSAVVYGAKSTWLMAVNMLDVIGQLFTGGVSVNELTGPVGIVYAVGDTAKYGFQYLGYLTALISLNLAIVNMLPIPALDGGRLIFIIIRLFTGNRISDTAEAKIHFVGIMLLFALMIYVTWNDIVRLIVPIFRG